MTNRFWIAALIMLIVFHIGLLIGKGQYIRVMDNVVMLIVSMRYFIHLGEANGVDD
jgi:hypothetical protein